MPRTNTEADFWRNVDKTPGCWLWTATQDSHGYGSFSFSAFTTTTRAHRIAYMLAVGPIPDGLVLDHLCCNKLCVNPQHLEPVTDRVNILRGTGVTAQNAQKTHCPQGHPYTDENVYSPPGNGYRHCRTCMSERTARTNAKRPKRFVCEVCLGEFDATSKARHMRRHEGANA